MWNNLSAHLSPKACHYIHTLCKHCQERRFADRAVTQHDEFSGHLSDNGDERLCIRIVRTAQLTGFLDLDGAGGLWEESWRDVDDDGMQSGMVVVVVGVNKSQSIVE